jgi:hypothetical protein
VGEKWLFSSTGRSFGYGYEAVRNRDTFPYRFFKPHNILPDLEPANYVLIFDFLRYITKRIKV